MPIFYVGEMFAPRFSGDARIMLTQRGDFNSVNCPAQLELHEKM